MQTEFIPVVANTQDLQYHRSPAQKWFLALVDRTMKEQVSTRSGSKLSGEAIGAASTRHDLNRQMCQTSDPQGQYICGPDGTPYGFTNDHDPPDISRFMDRCLTGYRARPPKQTVVSNAEKQAHFSIVPAPTTQVLQTFARIPKVPTGCSFLNEGVGRDFCWLYADEAALLADRAQKSAGAPFQLPGYFTRRIARFHLLDDVRGTPDMWGTNDIKRLNLSAKTIGREGNLLVVRFDGPFAMHNGSGKRGYEGSLSGYLKIDATTHQIARFRTFVDGKAWGAGTYTPNQPPGKYRMIMAIVDTQDQAARIVPPEEVATYNRDTRYRKP